MQNDKLSKERGRHNFCDCDFISREQSTFHYFLRDVSLQTPKIFEDFKIEMKLFTSHSNVDIIYFYLDIRNVDGL